MTTTSVQNSTNSLLSDIQPDNSIQTGANAGAATSFLAALDFHELVAASVNFTPAPKPASETTPSKSSESEDSSLAQSAAASYLVTGVQAMPVQAPLKIQTNQPETQGCNLNPNGNETLRIPAQLFSWALFASPITEGPTISQFQQSTQSVNNVTAGLSQPTALDGSQSWKNSTTEGNTWSSRTTSGQSGYISVQSLPIELLQPVDAVPVQPIPSGLSNKNSAESAASPRFSGIERQLADRNNAGSDETQSFTTRDDTVSSDPIAFEAKISSLAAAGNLNKKTAPDLNSPIPIVTRQIDAVESADAAKIKPQDLSPSASAASESEDSPVAQSAAAAYLVTGLQAIPVQAPPKIQTNQPETQGSADSMRLLTRVAAHPNVNLQSAQSATQAGIASTYPFTGTPEAPLEAKPKIETIPVSTQGSTDSRKAAISTSSDSSGKPNPNGDETLQIPAQVSSSALFAFPMTEGPIISRLQESTQSVNNLTAGLSQPTALNGSQSRKNSTTEGSISSSRTTSGQSGYISVQSLPIELLQPVDAVPIQPIPSDPSLTNSAEPAESPRSSGIERQLADRNNARSDETQTSTTRDDTPSSNPIAFEAKISSLAAAGNFNEKTAPYPNSPIPTVTRQVDRVGSVDAAKVKPEDLSPSASAAMVSFWGTPSGETKRPTATATAPEMPVTAQLDRLLESERHAESNQTISVNLTSPADGPVSVRFVERSGEVHVTVRTADPVLAQDFRSGLSDLSGRLEHAGFRAEVSSQSGTDPNLRRDSEQASPDSRNSGRQNPQPQREPEDAPPARRNPHTSKFAVSVNDLIKEQDA